MLNILYSKNSKSQYFKPKFSQRVWAFCLWQARKKFESYVILNTTKTNTFSSLEDNGKFKEERVNHIKKGNIYPIPKNDANFTKWTGVRNNPIKNVKIRNIKSIGSKTIKTRHLFYIGKFMDKKK